MILGEVLTMLNTINETDPVLKKLQQRSTAFERISFGVNNSNFLTRKFSTYGNALIYPAKSILLHPIDC